MKIEFVPFEVPDHVHFKMPAGKRQDGFKTDQFLYLKDLEEEDLSELCDKFRVDVFRKAEKTDRRINY